MRHLLTTVAILVASPVLAETIDLTAEVRAVTLYPQTASVTRNASADIPAGQHQIVIAGLPASIRADQLRVAAEGLTLGTFSLQTGRPLPAAPTDTPAIIAARDQVFQLERELRARDADIAAIRAEIVVAEDMASYLRGLSTSDGAATGDVAALTDFVGDRLSQARLSAIDAESRALAATQGREQQSRALDDARARLAALENPDQGQTTLILNVESSGAPAEISVTNWAADASWRPVYDLHLTEADRSLTIERGLMVYQATGEDWAGVQLTLSTAQPGTQPISSELNPRIVQTYDPEKVQPYAEADYAADAAQVMVEAMPVAAPMEARLAPTYQGRTVVYEYATPVDLRSGADEMRLSMDKKPIQVDAIVAEAVPSRDISAYLVVDAVNTLGEPLLPGEAALYAAGAMVGTMSLPLIPAGEEMKLGFGALDGIVLERRIPERLEGGRGMIRRDTERNETAILSVRNLTGRAQDLRIIDQVPVSQQEELEISWTASVDPTETDPDGKLGLLVWDMPLAVDETIEITLETTIRWPEGRLLSE